MPPRGALPAACALFLLLTFLTLSVVSYLSTTRPGSLLVRVGPCGDSSCVSWLMPAGLAWDGGARPGMEVVSVDGSPVLPSTIPPWAEREIDVIGPNGAQLHIEVRENEVGSSPFKFSLWAIGSMFALLAAAVLVRRPDLPAARTFAVFGWITSLALAVGPSAGGPAPAGALALQFLTIVGVGAVFLAFVVALVDARIIAGRILPSFLGAGALIVVAYGAVVAFSPSAYDLLRPFSRLYFSVGLLGGTGLLAYAAARSRSSRPRQQARVALFGSLAGALPFVGLTILPGVFRLPAVVPSHLTILALGVMPAAFAYAILQHQMLGIRRLVHRGMVYVLVTVALGALILVGLGLVSLVSQREVGTGYPSLAIAAILTVGIVMILPLQAGARWLVDRLLYKDTLDYPTFLGVMREDLVGAGNLRDVATGLAARAAEAFDLESALIFVGDDRRNSRLIASSGERSPRVLEQVFPQLLPQIADSAGAEPVELHWESESLLFVDLIVSGRRVGHMLLGPKRAGEVFVSSQKKLVQSMGPVVALALYESQLSGELRDLNQRLLKAEETERARVAADIHDGPLQKALLLARGSAQLKQDNGLASQLVSELREVCSRLRPAILDDLGLVSALDWLLGGAAKGSGLLANLHLSRVEEDQRFSPAVESALFRVAQEAINNAVKHAHGSAVDVWLAKDGNDLVLTVADDGVGFLPQDRLKAGFGLSGMRERVRQLDGALTVDSYLGVGTTVTARVPLRDDLNSSPKALSLQGRG